MNKTEMKSFLKESNYEIRIHHVGDMTVGITDKTGTMIIVSHDLDLPQKLLSMGAKSYGDEEANSRIGVKIREILDDRTYRKCLPIRVHVERNGEQRTLLLPESEGGSYSLPICVNTKKLDIFRSDSVIAAGPEKPIQIMGSDYFAMIFPIRVNRDQEWCKELNHIAWRL